MNLARFSSLRHISNLRHAITTRVGGVSQAPYESLNLGFHVGDDPEDVRRNREIVARELGFEAKRLVCAQQTHGSNVHVATPEDAGRGALDWDSAIPDTDALIVAHTRTPVAILVADCAPIMLVDAGRQVLSLVHAGWRGALGSVASHAVEKMREEFGCDPRDIVAGVGPCLCVGCLEVGEEVAQEAQKVDASTCIHTQGFSKPHLDLRGAILSDLARAQVLGAQVEVLAECPRCMNHKYFSHRGGGGTTGRFGIVAWWE
jgi:YfiH family protein